MSEERVRVLLVDDEASLRLPLKRHLENNFSYHVDAAADRQEALHLVEENQGQYDVALIDEVLLIDEEELPDEADGIQLMQQIKARYPDVEAIIFTGWGRESRRRAIEAGAFRYLEKPCDNDELAMVIRTAAQQVRLRAISRGILSEKDPNRVLESIIVAACSLALADEAAIVLLDQMSGKLRVHSNTYQAEPQWRNHLRNRNLSREIIETGHVFRVTDASHDERVNPKVIDAKIYAFLGLPIPGVEGNQGVLYVYSYRRGWFEEWGTVALLQTLAGQAGLALANAQAFRQLDDHARHMEALVHTGQGLTQATRPRDQLALAWDFVRRQLQVATFFVAIYDSESQTLHFPLVYDEGELLKIHPRKKGEEWGISGYVIESGQEIIWATSDEKTQQCHRMGIDPLRVGKECQSCIYLPLRVGVSAIGAVSIQSYRPHAFPSVLLDAFRALGSQLAVALENTRLFAELAEAKEWREALIENAIDAVIAIDQDRKVTVFNQRAEEMFGWTAGEMVGQTVARLHTDVKKAQEIFDLVNREGSVSDWEVELTHRGGDRIPALLSATQIRDSQGIPVGQAGFIQDLRQAHLLEDRLRAVIQVNKAITETLDLNQVFQRVIESAMLAFPAANGGSLHLYDGRTDLLQIRSNTFGYSEAAAEASCFHLGEGIAGWVFQYNQPAVVDDIQRDPRHKNIDHPEVPAHKSMICVPLRVRERVIGTLSLDNLERTGAFQAEDLGLLSTFADQAAIAIGNARRMQELEKLRQAEESMSRAIEPRQALQQIVESAAQVLEADSAAIWSYDEVRDRFIPEELTAVGIAADELGRFREEEPEPGRTADTVMSRGYVAVTDIEQQEHHFLGGSTRDLLQRIGVQSFQGIALRVGDERLGVLYVNYDRPRTFDTDAKATLQAFASDAALALKNARLLAQMQRTREAAGMIAGVTVQEDLNQTLRTIARHTQQILGSDAVTLYAYDETAAQFDGWAAEIHEALDPYSTRPPEELAMESVVWRILQLDEPPFYCLTEDDAFCHELLGGGFVHVEDIRAVIGLQLRVRERKAGVMFVNFRSAHRFTADEIAAIQLFADQAAVAIRNAQLYRVMHRLYEGLLQAGQAALEAARFYPEALQVIADAVKEISGCDVVTLYAYYDKEREITYPSVFAGELLEPDKHADWDIAHFSQRIKLDDLGGEVVLRRLLDSGESLYAADVTQEPVLAQSCFVEREKIKSSAAIILATSKRIVGILFVNYRRSHVFDKEEQERLNIFATQAAIAIQNIQQYAELRQARGLVGARTALAWMGMASSTWRHAIDKHALTIREQAQLLRQDWHSISRHPGNAKVPERIAIVERLATQILDRPITPPLSTEEGMESVPLNTLIGERARQLWQNDPYREAGLGQELALSDQATVRASPEWLRRAFDILVDNAVDAVADRSVRMITISTQQMNGGAEILVSDTGPGIGKEIRAKVGLELIEKPEDAQGLGMGLLMAQTIVQTYGGEIRVDSTGPEGTTMVIWLPLERQTQ
jgi:PAS domain S-box-containing protein